MSALQPAPPYIAGSITLPTGTGKSNLLSLIQALGGEYANCNGMANEVMLLADAGNTDTVNVGDAGITASNYGFPLATSVSRRYGPYVSSQFPLENLWVALKTGTAAQVLHFEIVSV